MSISCNPRPAVHPTKLLIFLQEKNPNWKVGGAAPRMYMKKWESSGTRLVCGRYNDVPSKKGLALAPSSAVPREPSSGSIFRDPLSCRKPLHSMLLITFPTWPMSND